MSQGVKTLSPAGVPNGNHCTHLHNKSSKTEADGSESHYFYFLMIHMHKIGVHSIIAER